ncbi:DUF4232 domain-containing protein [Streptomyces palmae]|uniref:DUF4232 domain-containing protein n=1 Tax=Streptomyces palmae TaxID=1701085 RepID=A0A4Z0H047_9ACTN|nr:DUF4232 domain-containing protein [Streptomyces palmae]TGB03015.1 DUF4232 domain-containing protein [Streptomyces palmae]
MNTSARKSPRGLKTYALGAAAVAAILTATACDPSGSDDTKSSDKASASSPAQSGGTAPSKPAGGSDGTDGGSGGSGANSGSDTGSDTGSGSGTDDGSKANGGGDSGGSAGSSAIAACETKDLSFGTESKDEPSEDVRHILITVTNTGSKKCNLYSYPDIHFNGARQAISMIKDSDGGEKFLTLEPGKDGYAALLLSGGGMDTMDVKNIPVRLQGAQPGSGMSPTVNVDLPGEEALPMDDGARVTAWGPAEGFLLRFIMDL